MVPDTDSVPPTLSLPVMTELVVVLLVIVAPVMTAFVVVELPTTRLAILASVATSDEMNPLVVVAFVVVLLVIVTPVKSAIDEMILVMKEFVA